MALNDVLGVSGLIIGIVSFAYAIAQGREMSRFKKYQTGQLRANLKDCIVVMSQSYRLTVNPAKFGISDPEAVKRIAAIHTTSASLIRSFFHELSEVDKPYDGRKLLEYVRSGIITSKWCGSRHRRLYKVTLASVCHICQTIQGIGLQRKVLLIVCYNLRFHSITPPICEGTGSQTDSDKKLKRFR